jgi:hypothetical protein
VVSAELLFDEAEPHGEAEQAVERLALSLGNSQEEVAGVFFSDPDGNRWAVQALPARE